MYKISYEKCVCFIFLVILAVLSCSGFRIDDLAMTDISTKRNSYSSSRTQPMYHHRIRHQRQLRAHLRHHDAQIFPMTTQPNELFAPIIARSQRSSSNQNRRNPRRQCQGEDISRKVYLAQIVVHAKAQSILRGDLDDTVTFSVLRVYKNSTLPVDDHMSITFHRRTTHSICERNEPIKPSKEYILFLTWSGPHNYTVFKPPEKVQRGSKNRILKTVRKITNPNFRVKPPQVVSLNRTNVTKTDRLQLVCKTKGLPIPIITWKKNGKKLHTNSSIKITYSRKRKSTLVVKKYTDTAKYECIAEGVNNDEDVKYYQSHRGLVKKLPTFPEELCSADLASYCMNGGTCLYIPHIQETYCQCPDKYKGNKCEIYTPASTYNQPTQTACNLGLQTKYFC